MRFCIKFNANKIPISYSFLFVSFIKRALMISDEDYFKSLYNYKNKSNKKIKDFTFSVMPSFFNIENDEMILSDGLKFYFSTVNLETALYFYNGITNIKSHEYKKEYKIFKTNSYLIKEKQIMSNGVIFNTMSPFFIKDKNNKILDVSDENFELELNYLANNILLLRGEGLRKKLKFENISLKKVVVKQEIADFTQNTGKKFFNVNALKGLFKLTGDREDLNYLYKSGLSFRKSEGLGMLEIAGEV